MFGKIKERYMDPLWSYTYPNSSLTPQVTDLFNCCLNQNIFEDSSYCRPVWHQLDNEKADIRPIRGEMEDKLTNQSQDTGALLVSGV